MDLNPSFKAEKTCGSGEKHPGQILYKFLDGLGGLTIQIKVTGTSTGENSHWGE